MKLCVISTASLLTPPTDYGGMELEAYLMVKSLQERGHTVSLIAKTGGSYAPNGALYEVNDEREIPDLFRRGIISRENLDAVIDFSHDKTFSMAFPEFPQLSNYQVMSKTGAGICPVLISDGQRIAKF